MRLGMKALKSISNVRRETRVPMEVGVRISGHRLLPGAETTFTENVSPRGARVFTNRHWKTNERLTIATLTGSFRALARVAYCHTVPDNGFAVGLEFLDPVGNWVMNDVAASPSAALAG
jgi:PilZ domain